jgi:hypothetical protein
MYADLMRNKSYYSLLFKAGPVRLNEFGTMPSLGIVESWI